MTKRHILLIVAVLACLGARAQRYSFTFAPEGRGDSVLYLARHYRDRLIMLDTARQGTRRHDYTFAGSRAWDEGVYVLVGQDGKEQIADFLLGDSRRFTMTGDKSMGAASVKVNGSEANRQMFAYMARLQQARRQQDSLKGAGDSRALDSLGAVMTAYESRVRKEQAGNLFFRLLEACDNGSVPDSVADPATHYRHHYWDAFFDPSLRSRAGREALLYSPHLYNKLNYFFFGLLYYASADTICRDLDDLMGRIGDDTAMRRYVLQFIEPRYYRSTKNIGWDAVWCHMVEQYYQKGLCPWAKESELYVMNKNHSRIIQSLIGAHGQELWMIDTTQIDAPEHWRSSHRSPERYVVLWFWDPDCHHCQEHSAELKLLYDSLQAAPDHRFEVYAVGYCHDVERWRSYVREHDFRWINVGGSNVNIDYQEAYNVHSAPTMIILDEHRDIIMNKMLPIRDLLPFLDKHEKKRQNGHH
ncbi:MAG: DUF5106 domain-containing protein [Bacteroidales bacterium]|nr:DUF5106 domain-containing protein [Bacteroidales bacterium]